MPLTSLLTLNPSSAESMLLLLTVSVWREIWACLWQGSFALLAEPTWWVHHRSLLDCSTSDWRMNPTGGSAVFTHIYDQNTAVRTSTSVRVWVMDKNVPAEKATAPACWGTLGNNHPPLHPQHPPDWSVSWHLHGTSRESNSSWPARARTHTQCV